MEQLTSHPSVIGTIIVSRTDNAIIKTTGHIFDGEGGKRYAAAVESIVKGVADALTACNDAENVGISAYILSLSQLSIAKMIFANDSIGRVEVHEDTNYET